MPPTAVSTVEENQSGSRAPGTCAAELSMDAPAGTAIRGLRADSIISETATRHERLLQ
jgi:hypothetical protein